MGKRFFAIAAVVNDSHLAGRREAGAERRPQPGMILDEQQIEHTPEATRVVAAGQALRCAIT